jgi:perosamine synthetase
MKVNLFEMSYTPEDLKAIGKVLERKTWWAQGMECETFENMVADYMHKKHCVLFNSGTSALHASMIVLGVGPGDEVIVPSFTFIATVNCVKMVGATPVFADIEEDTLGLDFESVRDRVTGKTKAIIPVHFAGCPCKYVRDVLTLDFDLVEDCAEAMGADRVGVYGDLAVLSFCQGKIISTGEGGAVVTNGRNLCISLREIQNHGRVDINSDFYSLGYNFRMSSYAAAFGISQLSRIEELIGRRRLVAERYYKGLSSVPQIKLPKNEGVFQMFPIRVLEGDRDEFKLYLKNKEIDTRVYFHPVHRSHYYRDKLGYREYLPVTEKVSSQILSIPMYPDLEEEKQDYVIETIKDYFKGN